MNWVKVTHLENNKYEFPGNAIKIHYYEALNILFRIENSLRLFVYIILKSEYLDKWHEQSITSDDENQSTIASIAKQRIAQDRNFEYLGYSNENPLMYLTSGELIRIITSNNNWKLFKNYFLGSKEIMKNKLDEIGNIRNSLAHFRPIKEGDVDLIRQNAAHTLTKIEEEISQIMRCSDTVPTNTEDEWYKELMGLKTEHCSSSFYQSNNEKWIEYVIYYVCPVVKIENYTENYHTIHTLKINTNNVLIHHLNLRKHILYATEYDFSSIKESSFKLFKTLRYVFDRRCLEKNYAVIKEEFQTLFSNIESQVDLITQDNLARGSLVEGIQLLGVKNKKGDWERVSILELESKRFDNEPVEYWGKWRHIPAKFISDTEIFPWMKVEISQDRDESDMPF